MQVIDLTRDMQAAAAVWQQAMIWRHERTGRKLDGAEGAVMLHGIIADMLPDLPPAPALIMGQIIFKQYCDFQREQGR